MAGDMVARVIGVAFMAAAPIWAVVAVSVNVVVIHAITVHGHEVTL